MSNNIKFNLAAAYQILAILKLDDHTYTHLSARSDDPGFYHIYPFGMRFAEVTPDSLLTVSLDGDVVEGSEAHYNITGYNIHSSIYKERPDINAIFHIHTPETVAVSCQKRGLLPISQWALHFYERVSYHEYNSLALDQASSALIPKDLDANFVMFLRNHGIITCGRTIHEAMFYTYHLQKACETQILALSMNEPLITPPESVCKKAVIDLLNFEKDLGRRDWEAWLRLLNEDFQKIAIFN